MSALPQTGDPIAQLTEKLRREVVEPAFASVASPATSSLPAVLLRSRRERAKGRIAEALAWRGKATVSAKLRREVEALIGRWALASFEDGFGEVEQFAIRCANENKARDEAPAESLAAIEQEYRREVARLHGSIEIRGLQTSARVLQSMDLVYVPLFVEDGSRAPDVIEIAKGIEVRRVPRERVEETLDRHATALIVGAPGSGKSTLVSYLALRALNDDVSLLPLVVPVRSLAGRPLDEATIAAVTGCDPSLVWSAFEAHRALVLIDGLDEIQGGADTLSQPLRDLAKAHPDNRFIATSRPIAGVEGGGVSVPGFATLRLQPLTRDEVYDCIERWCRAAERSLQKDVLRADADATRAADDLKERVRRSRPVERLAETPLMCSVLCVVHRFLGQRIPERRAGLYEACTNVLLYEWDRAKFPDGALVGKLDAQQKRTVLAGVAAAMHRERVAEIPKERAIELMGERLSRVGARALDAAGILDEIRDRSGLLVERSPGVYGFSHLTFQEYLTAFELAASNVGIRELLSHHKEPWWHEVIALSAGMAGPRAGALVSGLLDVEGKEVGAPTMLAAQCMETAIELPASLRMKVERRIATLVPPRSDEDMDRLVSLGEVCAPVLLRALDDATGASRARAALVLGGLLYEPAVATLVKMLPEQNPVRTSISFSGANTSLGGGATVGLVVAIALIAIASSSAMARRSLIQAISVLPESTLRLLSIVLDKSMVTGIYRSSPLNDGGSHVEELLDTLQRAITQAHPPKPPTKRGARSD